MVMVKADDMLADAVSEGWTSAAGCEGGTPCRQGSSFFGAPVAL
jgi:hypothetical protein